MFHRHLGRACFVTLAVAILLGPLSSGGHCQDRRLPPLRLTDRLHHLRIDAPREWSDFPEKPEAAFLELKFAAARPTGEWTLIVRQQDVKQTWLVQVNGKELARLPIDENDMVVYFAVPAEMLADGDNVVRVAQGPGSKQADDVRIGQIALDPRSRSEVLSEATVEVEVRDSESGELLPARITVLNRDGALQSVGAGSNDHLAVRPGIVYTGDGRAKFGLPAGKYTLYAGRGFEYSLDMADIEVTAGQTLHRTLQIRREVPTEGFVACDTHVHTLTHSGHGDATVQERMITLAAEGIELPIATDHNVHINHEPFARQMHVRQYFTPVIGNEVTTGVGHFNIFPVRADAAVPDFRPTDWKTIFANIYKTPDVKVVILNHARDLHSGVRPFGPKLHNAVVGENLEGWQLRANAMEVINSGAVQTDPMQLFRDWMANLNRGRMLTPVGGSDSHDVGRHFVGQGRTYIRARDDDPAAINIDEAVNNFVQGRVMVSYGLLTELTVDGRFGPGELAPATGETIDIAVRVLGPHWVRAEKVTLYANGQPIRESAIVNDGTKSTLFDGIPWTGDWKIPRPKHDVHLVAIAQGPGINGLFWKTAKPYQPTSPGFQSQVIGTSGAVWIDADGDGRRTPAFDYAQRLVAASDGNLSALLKALADYDEAVAAQAAHLW
ncbi:MAG TPA: CehA/McbA family metallohydrolase, partial [Pirellulaceae bacterium]|nr:CehA/McbA family metallohydrolase [Pirellulaceae bacterium]